MKSRKSSARPFTVREVTAGRWKDFEQLFEARGGPKYCWCMAWRATPEEARSRGGAPRKAAMSARVRAGVPVGLLGYLDDENAAQAAPGGKVMKAPVE